MLELDDDELLELRATELLELNATELLLDADDPPDDCSSTALELDVDENWAALELDT